MLSGAVSRVWSRIIGSYSFKALLLEAIYPHPDSFGDALFIHTYPYFYGSLGHHHQDQSSNNNSSNNPLRHQHNSTSKNDNDKNNDSNKTHSNDNAGNNRNIGQLAATLVGPKFEALPQVSAKSKVLPLPSSHLSWMGGHGRMGELMSGTLGRNEC